LYEEDIHIRLDRGITDANGTVHRHVRFRQVDGRTEDMLGGQTGVSVMRLRADNLLASQIRSLGGYAEVGADLVAALSRSDRNRIALELRRALFGDALSLSTTCENPACGAEVDIDLTIDELMSDVGSEVGETLAVPLSDGILELRPVIGRDDPDSPDIWPRLAGDAARWHALPVEEKHQTAMALERADKGPDLSIPVTCPGCRLPIELEIDPLDFLARELAVGARRLVAEIHCLAFHYGWSEADILALPRRRRWEYLSLITAQLTGGSLTRNWG